MRAVFLDHVGQFAHRQALDQRPAIFRIGDHRDLDAGASIDGIDLHVAADFRKLEQNFLEAGLNELLGNLILRRGFRFPHGKKNYHMLRRYCPPASKSASVIWPNEHTRTAAINTVNTLPPSVATRLSRATISAVSPSWRDWKSHNRLI